MNKIYDKFVNYFRSGIKSKNKKQIGIEAEHFIVEKNTNKAVPYYGTTGVKTVLTDLMNFYPNSKPIMDEDIIGFCSNDFNITLEPASQFEISINPYESIEKIKQIYKNFLNKIHPILNKFNYQIKTVSCQPKSNIDDIKLIPKKRYEFIRKYFKKIKSHGMDMLKGTCSLQASIDYFSENDFCKKIQVAYFLTPFFKLISNNSNRYQGKHFDTFLKRTQIYNNTDPKRCGIPPNIFSDNYGFEDYAKYLCDIPLIFYKKDGRYYETNKTFIETFKSEEVDEDQIFHISSIVYPNVRLKKYLEIRGADLMPFDYILGYCALIKGIFYSEENVDTFYNMIKDLKIDNKKVDDLEKNIIKSGWDTEIYGMPSKSFSTKVVELAKKDIDAAVKVFLKPYRDRTKTAKRVCNCSLRR